MADISKIKLPGDTTVYNLKDATARANSGVTGVKGNAEGSYRTGNVNLTAENVGAVNKSGDTMTGALTLKANQYYESSNAHGMNANNSDIVGIGSLYFNDMSNNGGDGINFPRNDSGTHYDSIWSNGGIIYYNKNREKNVFPNTKEADQVLTYPQTFSSGVPLAIRPYITATRANRFAFLPSDQIIIEQTVDRGETWTVVNMSDSAKAGVFAEGKSSWYLPKIDNKRSPLCGLRVTITANKYTMPEGTTDNDRWSYWTEDNYKSQERYCNVTFLYMLVTTSNDAMHIKYESSSLRTPDAWTTRFENDKFQATGWSGVDYIRLDSTLIFGGGKNQYSQPHFHRITFMTTGPNGTDELNTGYETQSQGIFDIRAYGPNMWAGNDYARYDRLYSFDINKNATFPAKVTASSFSGDVTGSANTLKSGGRPASANNNYHDGKMRYYLASSSMTTGKPNEDAQIIHLPWDNSGWDTQIAVSLTPRMYIRKEDGSGNWDSWKMVYTDRETIPVTNGGTGATTAANARTNLGLGSAAVADLSTSTSSTSTTTAATSSAVKTAYDLANTANGTANTALSGVNGSLIYDHTYTISNGVATFTPHVYCKGEEVTSNYAASCFTWKYRLASNITGTPSYVNLTTDSTTKGCAVTISTLGYGGHVIGTFEPPST